MNKTFGLIALASLSFVGVHAKTDVLEKAINQNNPKLVRAVRNLNDNNGIKLSKIDKARYVELAKIQVEKKKAVSPEPKLKSLLSVDGTTVAAQTLMLLGGIGLAWHAWYHATAKDPKDGDALKHEWHVTRHKWSGTFILGLGQSLSSIATIYKTVYQTDKAKVALENAEKVLELVEALPVA